MLQAHENGEACASVSPTDEKHSVTEFLSQYYLSRRGTKSVSYSALKQIGLHLAALLFSLKTRQTHKPVCVQ